MIITQKVINQVHDMLQWDRVLLDCDEIVGVPKTGAGILRVCQELEAKYSKPTELVIISWSVAEVLIQESLDIFMRAVDSESHHDQRSLELFQVFKPTSRNSLFEAGYVGNLDKRIPVVASIRAGRKQGLATVAAAPNLVEIGTSNTIYIQWA